jgi:hypothetical protein
MKLLKITFATGLSLLCSGLVHAEAVTLHCKTVLDPSMEQAKYELKIDLDRRTVKLGDIEPLEIIQINDHYITARSVKDGINVGGEVLVLDRINGDLKRTAVYVAATLDTLKNPSKNDTGRLVAKDFSGKCVKPLM